MSAEVDKVNAVAEFLLVNRDTLFADYVRPSDVCTCIAMCRCA